MTRRFLDISEEPVHICRRHGSICVKQQDGTQTIIPLDELEVVILAHPTCTVSQSALSLLAQNGIGLITSDEKRLPVGMLLPLATHSTQTERFAAQASASVPVRKRAWQAIVKAKIKTQGAVLLATVGSDHGLLELVKKVRSGDAGNLESAAARTYWSRLLPESGFSRIAQGPWPNPLFDYGYAILRSMAARAAAGHGLHPSLGIFHHNRYDAFCLANDLMEPFRPLVDRLIASLPLDDLLWSEERELKRDDKAFLIEGLAERYRIGGETLSLSALLSKTAYGYVRMLFGESDRLNIPRVEVDDRS